jgi:hypothetical protein
MLVIAGSLQGVAGQGKCVAGEPFEDGVEFVEPSPVGLFLFSRLIGGGPV